eukprot:7779096-Pyramimonas_sp.AAC.1
MGSSCELPPPRPLPPEPDPRPGRGRPGRRDRAAGREPLPRAERAARPAEPRGAGGPGSGRTRVRGGE